MIDASSSNTSEKSFTFRQKTVSWVAAITLPVIALGNFSEAVMIVESAIDRAISTFTNIPEYKDLGYLRSGINLDFAREIFGIPQVSRNLEQGLSAEYFFDEKYLLTLLVRSGEVMGYTVISLQEGFAPPVLVSGAAILANLPFRNSRAYPVTLLRTGLKTVRLIWSPSISEADR